MKYEPVTNLKRHATRIIAEVRESGAPLLITEHGRNAAVLIGADAFQAREERIRLLEGIARGERAVLEGRTVTDAAARARMRRWLA